VIGAGLLPSGLVGDTEAGEDDCVEPEIGIAITGCLDFIAIVVPFLF
jgi:hypothetical protein